MFVVVVDITVKEGAEEAFMAHMRRQAKRSIELEPGCRQFDVCVSGEAARDILLYEIYDDRAAFDLHLASAHFAEFDAAVQPLMESKTARFFDRDAA